MGPDLRGPSEQGPRHPSISVSEEFFEGGVSFVPSLGNALFPWNFWEKRLPGVFLRIGAAAAARRARPPRAARAYFRLLEGGGLLLESKIPPIDAYFTGERAGHNAALRPSRMCRIKSPSGRVWRGAIYSGRAAGRLHHCSLKE